jgi:hypothetical protein
VTRVRAGWIRWTTGCVALLALTSGTVSYFHMHLLVASHGGHFDELAWLADDELEDRLTRSGQRGQRGTPESDNLGETLNWDTNLTSSGKGVTVPFVSISIWRPASASLAASRSSGRRRGPARPARSTRPGRPRSPAPRPSWRRTPQPVWAGVGGSVGDQLPDVGDQGAHRPTLAPGGARRVAGTTYIRGAILRSPVGVRVSLPYLAGKAITRRGQAEIAMEIVPASILFGLPAVLVAVEIGVTRPFVEPSA